MVRLVIVGAGGFGREAADAVRADPQRHELMGVVDDRPSDVNLERLAALRIPYLGSVAALHDLQDEAHVLVAVGDPAARRRIAGNLESTGLAIAPPIVHRAASVGSASVLSPGVVVCAGARISTNVTVGAHSHVNPSVTIGHDTTLGSFVSINPGAIVSGDVVVEDGSLVGAGAVILQGLSVGAGAVVGAAACVTRSVVAGAVVKGVPAR